MRRQTAEERHFLTCQDDNCERAYCVTRREFENNLEVLRARIKKYEAVAADKLNKAILRSRRE